MNWKKPLAGAFGRRVKHMQARLLVACMAGRTAPFGARLRMNKRPALAPHIPQSGA